MTGAPRSPDLERAYATLGLPAGTPHHIVVRQYRRLVKRWHPDRFANEPQQCDAATRRMQELNWAFALVSNHRAPPPDPEPAPVEVVSPSQEVGRRLTPEEIDAISKSIGEPGIVPFIMRCLGWMGSVAAALLLLGYGGRTGARTPRTIEIVVASFVLLVLAANIVRAIRHHDSD